MIGITGAYGEIGSKICHFLATHNTERCFLVRDLHRAKIFDQANSCARSFDWSQPNASALNGVKSIFWLLPNEHRELRTAEIQWLKIAKQAGVQHIVKLSSMLAETKDIFFHRESEKLIEDSGIPFTHLRVNTFMQNFNEYNASDIKNHVLKYPAQNGKMSFIDPRDIAAIASKILRDPTDHLKKAYTLTGSESLDLSEVTSLFSQELNVQITYENIPNDQDYQDFYAAAAAAAAGEFARIDNSAAQILGRSPIRLIKYIHDYRCYFLNR